MDEPRNSPISNSIDRISNLPEGLIHHIFSFMDMTNVVQTCVLSKRWKNLWASTPILNFDFNKYSLAVNNNNNQNNGGVPILVPYQEFINFVNQVLLLHDSPNIQRVNLVCGEQRNFYPPMVMTASISTWITVAVKRNIQELILDISGVKISRFPKCLFTCTSLIKLELKLGDNASIVVLPTSMDLPRLTFMKLDSLLSTDVNMTNRLLSNCHVLESLIIEGRLGDMDLQISSLTLKHLEIVDFVRKTSSKVKIDAPNLVSFKCSDYISKYYVLENLGSLVTADINMEALMSDVGKVNDYIKNQWLFMRALSNVKELILSEKFFCLSLCGKAFGAFGKITVQFSNLRLVKLNMYISKASTKALGRLLHLSPNIESLSIVTPGRPMLHIPDSEDYWAGVSLPCKLNHLRSVEFRGIRGDINELKFVEIMFMKALVLEKMVLFSSKESTTDERIISFGEKLVKLPRVSSNLTTFLV